MNTGDRYIDVEETPDGVSVSDTRPHFFVAVITDSCQVGSGSGSGPGCCGGTGSGSGSGSGPDPGTACDCGWAHGWIEQMPARNGCGYENAVPGRGGKPNFNPAYDLNGNQIPVGTYVFMRERGSVPRTDMTGTVYDIIASATACTTFTRIRVVTNICCGGSGSGS